MTKIYTLSHPDTLEVRYIGKTIISLSERLAHHYHSCKKEVNHKGRWIKNLRDQGKKPIIELIEEVDDSIWAESEIYWISQFKAWGFRLTNIAKGGEKGGVFSKQCREAALKANLGKSGATKGRKIHNEESRKKMSLKRQGRTSNKGYKHNEKVRIRMGKSHIKGKIAKINLKGNIIEIFESGIEAARAVNGFTSNIYVCLKKTNNTYRGFRWRRLLKDLIIKQ